MNVKIPELLAPAGSPEGVRAAVQSGAGAVYMGFGTFNARRNAQGFSHEEMADAIAYCRARNVKSNITLNILVGDRELDDALEDAKFLYEAGADALIVQDLGLARLIHAHAPDFALHASTQMTIHTLDGARQARDIGFSRVVLSRECTREQIEQITREAGVETEVFVHGALCMCYSGQCYLSAVIGQRSGNRGLCAQPCRLPYNGGYPLSLTDLMLAGHVAELADWGVSSLKIEGRMKRPEYAAIVTKVYADLLREHRKPTAEERDILRRVFSRDGFTDGYYTGKKGDSMFGTKTDVPMNEVKALYDEAARRFAEGNFDVRMHNYEGVTEISELAESFNNMADSLQETERQRREFIANVSHELKTPMTTIAGYTDGILDGTIPPEQEKEYLRIISDEARRLSRLVRRMLEVSQLQSRDLTRTKAPFDVCESMRRVLISMEKKITDRGLDVDADRPDAVRHLVRGGLLLRPRDRGLACCDGGLSGVELGLGVEIFVEMEYLALSAQIQA